MPPRSQQRNKKQKTEERQKIDSVVERLRRQIQCHVCLTPSNQVVKLNCRAQDNICGKCFSKLIFDKVKLSMMQEYRLKAELQNPANFTISCPCCRDSVRIFRLSKSADSLIRKITSVTTFGFHEATRNEQHLLQVLNELEDDQDEETKMDRVCKMCDCSNPHSTLFETMKCPKFQVKCPFVDSFRTADDIQKECFITGPMPTNGVSLCETIQIHIDSGQCSGLIQCVGCKNNNVFPIVQMKEHLQLHRKRAMLHDEFCRLTVLLAFDDIGNKTMKQYELVRGLLEATKAVIMSTQTKEVADIHSDVKKSLDELKSFLSKSLLCKIGDKIKLDSIDLLDGQTDEEDYKECIDSIVEQGLLLIEKRQVLFSNENKKSEEEGEEKNLETGSVAVVLL